MISLCRLSLIALTFFGCSKDNAPVSESTDKTAIINLGSARQVIRGFGGVNMPGWTDVGDMTADQVNKAFGSGEGQLGLTILRIRVSYDSSQFYLELPTAKLAASLGAIIIATPWTPPAWMKTNRNIVGGYLDTSAYDDYANYLKSFADTMAANGAPLYAVSIQNEPDVTVTYESCYWNATQMLNFVKYNAPSVGTRIIMPESMNFNHALSDPTLNDASAANNVSIIGGHIYGGIQSYPLAESMGKEIWMTEHLDTDTSLGAVIRTGKEISDCMNAGMNAYLWWYIRRFYGPIRDDGNISKRGYVISQFARFVRPGFVRVTATPVPQSSVDVSAYRNGSKVVIIVLNRYWGTTEQTFNLQNGTVATFTPYVTSQTKNCLQDSVINVQGNSFTATLDPWSVTTFVSN